MEAETGVMGVCSWEQSAVLQMVVLKGPEKVTSCLTKKKEGGGKKTLKLSPVRIHHHFCLLLGSERSKQGRFV